MKRKMPSWLVDFLMAIVLTLIGVVVERQTQGRLWNWQIVLIVGVGGFVLLRLGALLARVGRTLGCGFAFGITWVLPCLVVLVASLYSDLRATIMDSWPFFILLGFFLIAIVTVTFERIRTADEARFRKGRENQPAES